MFLPSNITLKLGDSGDFVAELQRRLATRDLLTADMVTSFFDGATVNAVRQFQMTNGIRADGVAGPETLRRLNGITDGTSSTSGSQSDNEQAGAITPTNARILQLQMEEAALKQQAEIDQQMAQQAALQQQPQLPQHEKSQLLTETSKQLPGMEAGRDQHVSRAMERNENAAMVIQQQQHNQQAFIDRPITQTLQAAPTQDVKPEQDMGTHNRGPNLGLNPERSAEKTGERATETSIARPRDEPSKQPITGKEPERSAEQTQNTERAPLRVMSPSQGTSPDFARIKQQMESRLPPHVIEEVKQVGVVMIGNGVRGGQSTPAVGAPERTPGMEERTPAVGGGRGI